MSTKLIVAVLLLVSGSVRGADEAFAFGQGFWGGWGAVRMGWMNGLMKDGKAWFADSYKSDTGAIADPALTTVSGGYLVGAESLRGVASDMLVPGDAFFLGLRTWYVKPGTGELRGKGARTIDVIPGFFSWTISEEIENTVDSWAIATEIGGRYSLAVTDRIAVRVGMFVGAGYARADYRYTYERTDIFELPTLGIKDTSTDFIESETPVDGLGLAMDFMMGVSWRVAAGLSVGVDAGYRGLVTGARLTRDSDGLKKGDTWRITRSGGASEPVEFDFSGFSILAGVGYAF